MKKIFVLTAISITFLLSTYLFSQKQLSESVEIANPLKPEEQGSFLKQRNQIDSLRNSLITLTSALEKARKQPLPATPQYELEESSSPSGSKNSDWWLNSGGRLEILDGAGKTLQGILAESDKWRGEYRRNNPTDTDNGQRPQNIFRLVRRGAWGNLVQQTYFKINRLNLSDSPNRNASNGLFLFNRYQSGDDLYYTGIRVDGAVVIKKKLDGIYYTMAYDPIFTGSVYDQKSNPNLLPLDTWIGLRSEVINNPNGTVSINLYLDIGRTGNWVLALQTVDDGVNYGASPIVKPGLAGIRTDFMDVQFDNYSIRSVT